MKAYDTKDVEFRVKVLNHPYNGSMKAINIQFGPFEKFGPIGEITMTIPESIIKKKITNGSLAKHILNYFMKE